ncbi:uncharacterized protein LOC113501425 [Trichoplusia ni]|uniref:Uncharacterized protein LOC113501425 n=1 Tax=Trichoplusia ni TaxID=7111 RepID=A0A7E5WCH9_TRINI|nr:uncharacterized protein LOC113501425 [Trichoplusia ni]
MEGPHYYQQNETLEYYKVEIKQILYHLAVVLREPYNNRELEATAVRKVRVYSTLFFIISLMFVSAGGISAIHKVVTAGEIFCPVIPAWPSLSDTSLLSLVIRIIFYIFWLMYDVRVMAMFTLLLSMLVMIFYQFKNLQCYFYSLDKIFLEENLSQREKELKYENAFKLGIYMHAETLWVKKQNQHVCEWIFASEVTMSFIGLMVQLITIVSGKRDVSTVGTTFSMIMLTLISLAFFMWNGGDITIEALKVSDAMYFSGWENCSGQSSARVRKLVACAIRQAQEPVVYKTLGVVEFSYDAYVKISKLPYTVVSMFY